MATARNGTATQEVHIAPSALFSPLVGLFLLQFCSSTCDGEVVGLFVESKSNRGTAQLFLQPHIDANVNITELLFDRPFARGTQQRRPSHGGGDAERGSGRTLEWEE